MSDLHRSTRATAKGDATTKVDPIRVTKANDESYELNKDATERKWLFLFALQVEHHPQPKILRMASTNNMSGEKLESSNESNSSVNIST